MLPTVFPFLMIAGDFYSAKDYAADYPFITIDSDHYKTRRYNRSIKRLFQALGSGENWWHNYFLFRRGELVSSGMTLEEITSLTFHQTHQSPRRCDSTEGR